MSRELRNLYAETAERLPPLGDYPEIVTRGRRLRRRRRVHATLAGGALAVIITATIAAVRLDVPTGTVDPSAPSAPEAATTLDGWTPNLVGEPAAAGTALYRDCQDSCRDYLTQPGSPPIDLYKARPELQPLLEAAALEGVTLSFDAKWLGIPDGNGYVITALSPDAPLVDIPRGPEGSVWEPVGWTTSSASLALALQSSAGVQAYAQVDTSDPLGEARVHVLQENPLPGWLPVGNGGDSVQVAKPEVGSTALLDTRLVFVSSDQFEPGDSIDPRSAPLDLAACIKADETIVGPDGVPVLSTPPPPDPANASEGDQVNAVLVFQEATKTVSAVVGMNCANDPGSRYDVSSAVGDGSSAPHPITTTSSLLVRGGSESLDVLLISGFDQPRRVLQLPAGSQVVLPGG